MRVSAIERRFAMMMDTFGSMNGWRGHWLRVLTLMAMIVPAAGVGAVQLVSPFEGSVLLGEYHSDYDKLVYLRHSGEDVGQGVIEGELHSRIFAKPGDKSTLEVFRSYERELSDAGFEILASLGGQRDLVQQLGRQINRDGGNALPRRAYSTDGRPIPSTTADRLATFAEHYLAARRSDGGTEIVVVVLVSDQRNLYAVDVVQRAVMEADTVNISLDSLRAAMQDEGRSALYGIYFDTGSATLRAESDESLGIIAAYLRENPERSFHVVGHTDARGALQRNLTLSRQRAEATVQALIALVPDAASRLDAHGVGPLSPVASNAHPEGRQRNRRVELVASLE